MWNLKKQREKKRQTKKQTLSYREQPAGFRRQVCGGTGETGDGDQGCSYLDEPVYAGESCTLHLKLVSQYVNYTGINFKRRCVYLNTCSSKRANNCTSGQGTWLVKCREAGSWLSWRLWQVSQSFLRVRKHVAETLSFSSNQHVELVACSFRRSSPASAVNFRFSSLFRY